MKIEIIAVGTELLNGRKSDAHGPWLGLQLNELGLAPRFSSSVADDIGDIEAALHMALGRSELVIVCGGLGPTLDDVTREAVAAVAACPLAEDPGARATLETLFSSRGRTMTPNNLRQAQVPQGAVVLPNPVGTAPGLRVPCQGQHSGRTLILLPGPPHELQRVFLDAVLPWLKDQSKAPQRHVKVLNCWGLGESAVDQALLGLVEQGDTRSLAMLAHGHYVELRLSALTGERLEAMEAGVLERLGDSVFSTEGRLLEEVVSGLLIKLKGSLAIAESCTGGRIASKLSSVPGASQFLKLAVVTYSDESKTQLLEVPPFVIKKAGAVSKDTALAMAVGLARRFGADYNLSVTGLAGPGGGSPEKPVGLVHFALAGPEGIVSQEFRFGGGSGSATRQDIQARAAQAGLFLLYRVLSGLPVNPEDSDRAALPSVANS